MHILRFVVATALSSLFGVSVCSALPPEAGGASPAAVSVRRVWNSAGESVVNPSNKVLEVGSARVVVIDVVNLPSTFDAERDLVLNLWWWRANPSGETEMAPLPRPKYLGRCTPAGAPEAGTGKFEVKIPEKFDRSNYSLEVCVRCAVADSAFGIWNAVRWRAQLQLSKAGEKAPEGPAIAAMSATKKSQALPRIAGLIDGETEVLTSACAEPIAIRSDRFRVVLSQASVACNDVARVVLAESSVIGLPWTVTDLKLTPFKVPGHDGKHVVTADVFGFSKLPPGIYTLHVFTKCEGNFVEVENSIKIRLQKPAVFTGPGASESHKPMQRVGAGDCRCLVTSASCLPCCRPLILPPISVHGPVNFGIIIPIEIVARAPANPKAGKPEIPAAEPAEKQPPAGEPPADKAAKESTRDICCEEVKPGEKFPATKFDKKFVIASPAHFPRPGFDQRFKHYDLDGAVIYENMQFTVLNTDGNYEVRYCVSTPETVQLRLQLVLGVAGNCSAGEKKTGLAEEWYTLTLPTKTIVIANDPVSDEAKRRKDQTQMHAVVVRGVAPFLAGRVPSLCDVRRRGSARFGSLPATQNSGALPTNDTAQNKPSSADAAGQGGGEPAASPGE